MAEPLRPILLVDLSGQTCTWRFEPAYDTLKARVLARMAGIRVVERWGILPANASFTRRSEYEAVLKAAARPREAT